MKVFLKVKIKLRRMNHHWKNRYNTERKKTPVDITMRKRRRSLTNNATKRVSQIFHDWGWELKQLEAESGGNLSGHGAAKSRCCIQEGTGGEVFLIFYERIRHSSGTKQTGVRNLEVGWDSAKSAKNPKTCWECVGENQTELVTKAVGSSKKCDFVSKNVGSLKTAGNWTFSRVL